MKVKDIALDNSRWPEDALKFQNNFNTQYQVPVLWYALLPLLLVTGKADWVAVALSWAFVASRIVHTLIHTGGNVVIRRFQVFVVGFTLVALMWCVVRDPPFRDGLTQCALRAAWAAAIDVLTEMFERHRPASEALKDWARRTGLPAPPTGMPSARSSMTVCAAGTRSPRGWVRAHPARWCSPHSKTWGLSVSEIATMAGEPHGLDRCRLPSRRRWSVPSIQLSPCT